MSSLYVGAFLLVARSLPLTKDIHSDSSSQKRKGLVNLLRSLKVPISSGHCLCCSLICGWELPLHTLMQRLVWSWNAGTWPCTGHTHPLYRRMIPHSLAVCWTKSNYNGLPSWQFFGLYSAAQPLSQTYLQQQETGWTFSVSHLLSQNWALLYKHFSSSFEAGVTVIDCPFCGET